MTISIDFTIDAQRMLDEADERWIAEHGFGADNPLVEEIHRAHDRLRENPQIAAAARRSRRSPASGCHGRVVTAYP